MYEKLHKKNSKTKKIISEDVDGSSYVSHFFPDFKYMSDLLLPFIYVYPYPFKHVASV